MFELTIETVFCAAHSIVMCGEREPLHGHNWHVTLCIRGPVLDEDGLLVDFHAVERQLAEVVTPFHNGSLNDVPPFDETNPTAELVAKHIGERTGTWLRGRPEAPDRGVRIAWCRVTEADRCAATWVAPDAG